MTDKKDDSVKRPRAVGKEGKIGAVSAYTLDDGRCVLSERGVVLELSGATHEGNLGRYLARLSSKVEGLTVNPSFEFILPGGGIANAVIDEDFMKIVSAYVDGLVLATLAPKQIPVAQRMYELQKTWAPIGLRAHILSITGQEPATVVARVRSFAELLFRREPRDWSRRFSPEFVQSVCGVYNWHVDGKRIPHQMSAVFAKLYTIMLGPDGKAALKARNPDPRWGSNHHQHLSDELDTELIMIERAIIYIAHRSGHNIAYFWRQVEELLGITSIQIDLPLNEPISLAAKRAKKG
jgi:hypothetical protein